MVYERSGTYSVQLEVYRTLLCEDGAGRGKGRPGRTVDVPRTRSTIIIKKFQYPSSPLGNVGSQAHEMMDVSGYIWRHIRLWCEKFCNDQEHPSW